MDELTKGERYRVISEDTNYIDLCRKPTKNATTGNGEENVILSMPSDTVVVLENIEPLLDDGKNWWNVRYSQEEKNETGWVHINYMLPEFLIPVTGSPESPAVNIQFDGSLRFSNDKVWLLNIPPKVLGGIGLVTFRVGDDDYATPKSLWNVSVSDKKFEL